MQTFLPYESFIESAKCLDYRRLGKQRVEAKQIIEILLGNVKPNKYGNIPWINHPAVKMWKDNIYSLMKYYNIIVEEWKNRGYKNNMLLYNIENNIINPTFIGNEEFHNSHKSNLLRKNYDFYSKYNWKVVNNLEYVWPK
jgi:hypothetical protein